MMPQAARGAAYLIPLHEVLASNLGYIVLAHHVYANSSGHFIHVRIAVTKIYFHDPDLP